MEVYCIGDTVYQVRVLQRQGASARCLFVHPLHWVVAWRGLQEDDICRTLYIVAAGTVQLVWPEKDSEGGHKVCTRYGVQMSVGCA